MRGPVTPHPHQHLLWSMFFILAILIGRYYVSHHFLYGEWCWTLFSFYLPPVTPRWSVQIFWPFLIKLLEASLVAQMVKIPPAMHESWVWTLGLGRSPGEGNGNSLQYSCMESHKESDRTEQLYIHTYIYTYTQPYLRDRIMQISCSLG